MCVPKLLHGVTDRDETWYGVAFKNHTRKVLSLNLLLGMEEVIAHRLFATVVHFV